METVYTRTGLASVNVMLFFYFETHIYKFIDLPW